MYDTIVRLDLAQKLPSVTVTYDLSRPTHPVAVDNDVHL